MALQFFNGIVEPFTIVLGTRNMKKLGTIYNISDLNYVNKFNAPHEVSFTVTKLVDDYEEPLWDEIKDLRVIWVKETNKWFEIKVSTEDQHDIVKNVTATALCENELSQTMLYNLNINTEEDLTDGYYILEYDSSIGCNIKKYVESSGYAEGTLFYNPDKIGKSLLHRVLDKCPNYTIGHVDESLQTLIRYCEFKFDGKDVLSALNEIGEEYDVMFTYEIVEDRKNHTYQRTVNAYDLDTVCKSSIVDTEALIAAEEKLQYEYQKIEDWGLTEYEDEIKNKTIQTVYGNIDMDNRPIITWNESTKTKYRSALNSWGYSPEDGTVDTVYGCRMNFTWNGKEVTVAFSPITREGNSVYFISKSRITSYINDVLNSSTTVSGAIRYDLLNSVYSTEGVITRIIADIWDPAVEDKKTDLLMHFSGYYGSIQMCEREIDNIESEGICNYRGVFSDVCPKCGGKHLKYYGTDTTILASIDNLTDQISFEADVDQIKNTFRLETGDDDMTTAVINCNGGGQYIYNITQEMRQDMSDGLIARIDKFNATVDQYRDEYQEAAKNYYNGNDWYLYLHNSMMPNSTAVEGNITATTEAEKIRTAFNTAYSTGIALPSRTASAATATTAVKSFASMQVYTGYVKVEVVSSEFKKITIGSIEYYDAWSGKIRITNYSDDKDIVDLEITDKIYFNEDYDKYVQQRIQKIKSDYKDLHECDVLKITNPTELRRVLIGGDSMLNVYSSQNAFVQAVKNKGLSPADFQKDCNVGYAYESVKSYQTIYESVLDMLSTLDKSYISSFVNQYTALANVIPEVTAIRQLQAESFDPQNASSPTAQNMKIMNNLKAKMSFNNILSLDDIQKPLYYKDASGKMTVTKQNIDAIRPWIPDVQIDDIVTYNYTDVYMNEFCSFRREDTYQNSNYISTDLGTDDLYTRAVEFVKKANDELIKAATPQYSISSSLKNFLLIPEFEPLVEYFEVGNWMRFMVDDNLYRLRLLSYTINFDDLQSISCEFSSVTQTAYGMNDVQSILNQATSMAGSYSATTKQAEAGNTANNTLTTFVDDGLASALKQISTNGNQEFYMDENGLWGKQYDDFTGEYSPKQLRITHNILAFTEDNWASVETALGEHQYSYYSGGSIQTAIGYGLTSKFVTSGYVTSGTIVGGHIYSDNYSSSSGSHIDLTNGQFSLGGGKLTYNGSSLYVNGSGYFSGSLSSTYFSADSTGVRMGPSGNRYAVIDSDGASFRGAITATSGTIGNWSIKDNNLTGKNITLNGTSGTITSSNSTGDAELSSGELTFSKITSTGISEIATFSTARWKDKPTKYGVSIQSESESKFITFGNYHKDDNGTVSYLTPFILNYGLDPDDYTEDVLVYGRLRVTGRIFLNDSNSYINSSISTYNGTYISDALKAPRIFAGNYVHGDYVLDVNGASYFSNPATFNSNIEFTNNNGEIRGTMGANDFWMIKGYGSSDNGVLEISTGDNGDEPIVVRQYSGGSPWSGASVKRTAYLLNSVGNTVFPGKIYMNSNDLVATQSYVTSQGYVPGVDITQLKYCPKDAESSYLEVTAASYGAWGIDMWKSDINLKTNIKKTNVFALDKINEINLIQFDWNGKMGTGTNHVDLGISANQLQEVIPNAVFEVEQGEDCEFSSIKQISSNTLMPYCIKAIQELSQQIKDLKGEI